MNAVPRAAGDGISLGPHLAAIELVGKHRSTKGIKAMARLKENVCWSDTIMPQIVDDKSEHCVPFILERIKAHQQHFQSVGEDVPPFFLGLNGVQGAGKTTLVGQ